MKLSERYLEMIQALEGLTTELRDGDIAQLGVDIAQRVTDSKIAYLHFLNEDQQSIELGRWSHDTLQHCTAVYDRHYPLDTAGLWADSARQRQPCLHNDYARECNKHGLPDGHSPLHRHLGLPVVDEGKVRLLIGVGNKEDCYDDDDILLLQLVANRVWSVVKQRRRLEYHLDLTQRFRHLQEIALVTGFEYDVDLDCFSFDGMFAKLFAAPPHQPPPVKLSELVGYVAPEDHHKLHRLIASPEVKSQQARIRCLHPAGSYFPAKLKIEFRPRAIGEGVIGIGTLQDISEQVVVEDLRQRVDRDHLTGLLNRSGLNSFFAQDLRRRQGKLYAFHFIDLDGFKQVNDSYGHAFGDEVLRVVADRLQFSIRRDDLAVRVGGDEFMVVQTLIDTAADACTLAEKIIGLVAEPIATCTHTVHIGASIGIAMAPGPVADLKAVSACADRALYLAKSQGGGCYLLDASTAILRPPPTVTELDGSAVEQRQ